MSNGKQKELDWRPLAGEELGECEYHIHMIQISLSGIYSSDQSLICKSQMKKRNSVRTGKCL